VKKTDAGKDKSVIKKPLKEGPKDKALPKDKPPEKDKDGARVLKKPAKDGPKNPVQPNGRKGKDQQQEKSGDGTASKYDLTGGYRFVHFGSGGTRVVLTDTGYGKKKERIYPRVYDLGTDHPLTPPLKHDDEVWHAAFSPDGKRVVTASNDKTVRLWDAATGKELTAPLNHDNWVLRAAFSPDGNRVVTADSDSSARLWDAATGKELKQVTLSPK
jgi:WD40 repeat protein